MIDSDKVVYFESFLWQNATWNDVEEGYEATSNIHGPGRVERIWKYPSGLLSRIDIRWGDGIRSYKYDSRSVYTGIDSVSIKIPYPKYTSSLKPITAEKPTSVKPEKYKFSEDKILAEIGAYIDGTYTEHYSGKYQATDMIIDAGHGTGFAIGSIMKYAKRFGKKGGYNRKDLLKIIHYAMIAMYIQDNNES